MKRTRERERERTPTQRRQISIGQWPYTIHPGANMVRRRQLQRMLLRERSGGRLGRLGCGHARLVSLDRERLVGRGHRDDARGDGGAGGGPGGQRGRVVPEPAHYAHGQGGTTNTQHAHAHGARPARRIWSASGWQMVGIWLAYGLARFVAWKTSEGREGKKTPKSDSGGRVPEACCGEWLSIPSTITMPPYTRTP